MQFLAKPRGLLRYELAALRDRRLIIYKLRRSRAQRLNLFRQVCLLLPRAFRFELQTGHYLARFIQVFFGGAGCAHSLRLRDLSFGSRRCELRFARGNFTQDRLYISQCLTIRPIINHVDSPHQVAHLLAQPFVAARARRLTLQAVLLSFNFGDDVGDASEILFGGFELQARPHAGAS